jgi:hypothetical protein
MELRQGNLFDRAEYVEDVVALRPHREAAEAIRVATANSVTLVLIW